MRRTFPTIAKARAWRAEAQVDLRRGALNAPTELLFRDAAERWLAEARSGVVRTRSGTAHKPSAIRGYEATLRRVLLPRLGHLRISAVSRRHLQDCVDALITEGYAPSTVANAMLPARAIFRRAIDREEIAVNPSARLRLPHDRRPRTQIAEPDQIDALLAVLPREHQTIWLTALRTGLRRGELQALRWPQLHLDRGVLEVVANWDRVAGLIDPKSRSGERTVPIPEVLRRELLQHRRRQGAGGQGLVFASPNPARPFDPSNTMRVARREWKRAGPAPISFHACRHSYASHTIAAGVNPKALCAYMGHSSITVTMDRYGHLISGNEREAAALLDDFLARKGTPPGAATVSVLGN